MKNKELIICKHSDFNRNTHILSLQQSSACTWVTWVNNLLLVEIRFPDNSYSSRDSFQQNMFSVEGIITEYTFSRDNFQHSTFSYLPTGGLGDISTPSANKTIILNLVKHLFHIIINTENIFYQICLMGSPNGQRKTWLLRTGDLSVYFHLHCILVQGKPLKSGH